MFQRKKYRSVISLVLCIALLFANSIDTFALQEDSQNGEQLNEQLNEQVSLEEYPLVDAFLNKMMDHSQEDKEEVYVLEFEEGRKDEIIPKLEQIEGLQLKYEYDTLFEGVSIKIKNSKISAVKEIDGVKNIQKNGSFVPYMVGAKELSNVLEAYDYNDKITNSDPSKKLDGRSLVIAIIDSGVDISHPAMKIDEDAKQYVKIKESDVKEGFSLKIPHGFNYLSGNYDLMDRVTTGHGMHIAGIIAGNSEHLKGIAPNAQILMYRMFSDRAYYTVDKKGNYVEDSSLYEHAGDDAVYHAMEDAVKHGADVISMSIGRQGGGYAGDIFYNAVKNATDKGVIVVTAIGNYSSSASTNTFDNVALNEHNLVDTAAMTYYSGVGKSLAVGSVTNIKNNLDKFRIGDRKFGYSYLGFTDENKEVISKFKESQNENCEFVYVGHARESAFKDVDVKGKIAVALRGGGRIDEKLKNAAKRGAKGFVLVNAPIGYSRDHYNEYPVVIYGADLNMTQIVKHYGMWAISISGSDGDKIKSLIRKDPHLDFEFLNEYSLQVFEDRTKISGFSGWGPNAELELKPEVVAAGERVFSTFNRGRYGYMSGTSMATPQVAAMSALLKSKLEQIRKMEGFHNSIDIIDLNKIILMNSALPIYENKAGIEHLEYSPRVQGAGLVQLDKALKNEVLLTYNNKGAIELKEIKGKTLSFELNLYNFSDEEKSFVPRFGHVLGEGTVSVEKLNSVDSARIRKPFEDEFKTEVVKETHPKQIEDAVITTDVNEITVPSKGNVRVKMTLNTGKSKDEFVEGYIYFDSKEEKQPNLSIPYFGYKGDWNKAKIMDDPMWEETSLYKLTTILGKLPGHHDEDEYVELGKNEKGMIQPLDIAFSNQNRQIDGKFPIISIKEVSLRLITLREARDLEVSILDENKETLRILSNSHFFKKMIANLPKESEYRAKAVKMPNPLFKWDGKLYDKKKGEYVSAKDGQYYYRVRARVKTDSPFQEILLPVKIDNTRPVSTSLKINENDATFKVQDDHGLWFVGASIDNKPVQLHKISENEYSVDKKDINPLTTSKLRVEAMDFAGNLMEPIVVELNKPMFKFDNLIEVRQKIDPVLKGSIQDDKISSVEAKSGNTTLEVEQSDGKFEIDLNALEEGAKSIHIVLKDKTGEVLSHHDVIVVSENSAISHSSNFPGPKIYPDISDEFEKKMRKALDDFMHNYIEPKEENLNEISEGTYSLAIEVNFDWRNGFGDDDEEEEEDSSNPQDNDKIKLSDYKLKLTSINTSKNGFKPMTERILESGITEEEVKFTLMEGTNIINATVYHKNDPNKIIASRGHLVYVDPKAPIISEDGLSIEYDEDADEDDVKKGKIYTNSKKLKISGHVSDNGEDWRMYVNGNNVESELQTGQFGDNKKEFSAIVEVEDKDKLTLEAIDKNHGRVHANHVKKVFEVVLDMVAPEIVFTPDKISEFKNETELQVEYKDEHPLRKENCYVMVNGQKYETGTALSQYGKDKFFIYAVAVDKAGNKTEKEFKVNLEEEDKSFEQITLKKKVFEISELEDPNNIVEIPQGFKVEFADKIDTAKEFTEVLFYVQNQYGIRKKLGFSIQIAGFVPEIKALELKKTHYLAQELKSEEALFDIPAGMGVEIEPIDASDPGEKIINVVFYKNSNILRKKYTIQILPELDARLKKKDYTPNESLNIENVIHVRDGFRVKYKQNPDITKLGEQQITVIVEDEYGHAKEMTFSIVLYKEPVFTPDWDATPSEESRDEKKSSDTNKKPDKKAQVNPLLKNKEEPKKEKQTQLSTSPFANDNVIADVKGHWAKELIYKAYADKYVTGYPDGSFKPDNHMLRGEFSSLANRVFKLDESDIKPAFIDVPQNSWYYKAVSTQFANGLMHGVSSDKFEPQLSITRAEVVVIFIRYIEKFHAELFSKYEKKSLHAKDIDEIPNWAMESFNKAYSMGLIVGDDKNQMQPNAPVTRAQVVQIIYNFLKIQE